MGTRLATAFQHFDQAELRFCRYLNRPSGSQGLRAFFRGVSRLGDGWLWYAMIALMPLLLGTPGWLAAAQLAATGGAGLLAYKLIKRHAVRERPFITHPAIHCAAAPLDRYSFPSGHTLHAIAFSLVACSYYPGLWIVLWPFALLTAVSRVALGLHYPSDVIAGGALGALIAGASFAIA